MLHGGTGAASYPVAALIRLMIPAAPHYLHLSPLDTRHRLGGTPSSPPHPPAISRADTGGRLSLRRSLLCPGAGFPATTPTQVRQPRAATASREAVPVLISAICMICLMVTVPPLFTLHTRVVPSCQRLCSPGPVIMLSPETYRAGFGGQRASVTTGGSALPRRPSRACSRLSPRATPCGDSAHRPDRGSAPHFTVDLGAAPLPPPDP